MTSLKQKTLDLKKRMQSALQGGGEKAVEKQVSMGKWTQGRFMVCLTLNHSRSRFICRACR
jgi:hypothetical protein